MKFSLPLSLLTLHLTSTPCTSTTISSLPFEYIPYDDMVTTMSGEEEPGAKEGWSEATAKVLYRLPT